MGGEDAELGSRDHGRRSRHRHSDEEDEIGMDVDVKPIIVDGEGRGLLIMRFIVHTRGQVLVALLPVDAEADNAIEIALERTRKLLNAKREGPEGGGAAKVARILQQAPQVKQETPFSEGGVAWGGVGWRGVG